jgi:hypothetical protein
MAAPAAHEVEQRLAGRQHLGVQVPERGDGAVVDVNDPARVQIKLLVG